MGRDDKDGYYCSICGGIPPDLIKTKKILIDGKKTGIDHLDGIFDEVKKLKVTGDDRLAEEILLRVNQFNYVPTKKVAEYREALLRDFKAFLKESGG